MIVFHLETQFSTSERGGWPNLATLRLAVACTWDELYGYRSWWEAQAADLVEELNRAELVVGYNINAFDTHVLQLYGDVDNLPAKSFDILDHIWQQTDRRVSLARLVRLNLDKAAIPTGNGRELWRLDQRQELADRCQQIVATTRRLYRAWQEQGILFVDSADYAVWPGPVPSRR